MQLKIKFLGATRNVTGSRHLLEVNDKKILLDCGVYQERELRYRNWEPFNVEPGSIDFILLSHAHLDHCGYIPRLVKEGFKGKIFCTSPTQEIARIVMLDSAHIQEEDAEFKRKRHEKEGRKGPYPEVPLYTTKDAEKVFPLFEAVHYEEEVKIDKKIKITFHNAGHILGSSIIKLTFLSNTGKITLLFSGDLGRWNKPIINDPVLFEETDYLIVESTYGDAIHEDVADVKSLLKTAINSTAEKGGNILIPSFAIERTQELLYYLNKLLAEDSIPHLLVFLDSPMAINVTEVFKKYKDYFDREMLEFILYKENPFYFSNLKLIKSVEESKAINHVKGSSIIIAGSGMCTGGRIKHHLANNIWRNECTVLFIGYQAKGTLGREIVEGAKQVRIHGKFYPVNAKIIKINGFSAHADREELRRWVSGFRSSPGKTFVVHGEEKPALSFAELLRKEKNWDVSVPFYGQEFILS